MAQQFTPVNIGEAVARGHDVFDLIIGGWGTTADDRWPAQNRFSNALGLDISPAGIAIGPESTVDRCWISWDPAKKVTEATEETSQTLVRCITNERPLMFSQPAGRKEAFNTGTPAGAIERALMFVFPTYGPPNTTGQAWPEPGTIAQTLSPDGYYRADGTFNNGFSPTVPPQLHLQFLLKRDVLPPTGKRAPFNAFGGNGFLLPTFGRRHIHVVASTSAPTGGSFRLAALRGVHNVPQSGPTAHFRLQETTEGLKTTTAADESVHFNLCDPCADYTLLYVTPNEEAGSYYQLTAYD